MRWFIRIFGALVALVILALLLNPKERKAEVEREKGKERSEVEGRRSDPAAEPGRDGLNRQAVNLIYSKHARCRMGCRHISEDEVLAILRDGEINHQKSDMRGNPDPKYAVEGNTNDGQKVRIVFAQSPRGVVVVTVIDLGREWQCDCK